MNDPGTYSIVGRLAVAGFVMIAPTLLFLGLVRGLEHLRNDAFIDEWLRKEGRDPAALENDDVLAVLADGVGLDPDGSTDSDCLLCGAPNRSDGIYCQDCLGQFSS
ncbi:zinc ribbon domain-containing protein [Halosolutus gelatinilyticus]|uniref:zinc ribbon domain-containing protein n=1 Tax=Halosolutus gelatinilyticus TaxID=2931975 RepID=UPI001FF1E073|nr:zinc ribbon domain-containing protein [Halosolutus gelatinilyticus]